MLCVLIVLPLSWLLLYSLTDAKGAFTLANFYRLFTESSFYDPLVTTFIIATSSARHLLRGRRADGLAGGAHRPAVQPADPRAGDGLVRDAAVPRRHRLGAAGGAQQRPAQQALRAMSPAADRTSICSTSTR